MQEKIGDDHAGRRRRREVGEHVLRNLLLPPAELVHLGAGRRGHDRLLIDQDGGDARPMPRKTPGEAKHQAPVARAKLDDPFRRNRREAAQTPGHHGGMQHHRIEELEIAARVDRGGIVGRQNVEEFSLEMAREGHDRFTPLVQAARPVLNNMVSAMRPGPKAMPQPAALRSPEASNLSSTNMTVADDMLPKSRSTPREVASEAGGMAKARSTASTTVRPPG